MMKRKKLLCAFLGTMMLLLTASSLCAADIVSGNTTERLDISAGQRNHSISFNTLYTDKSYSVIVNAVNGVFTSARAPAGVTVKPVSQTKPFSTAIAEKMISNRPDDFAFVFSGFFRPVGKGNGEGNEDDLPWSIEIKSSFFYITPQIATPNDATREGIVEFTAKSSNSSVDEKSDWYINNSLIKSKSNSENFKIKILQTSASTGYDVSFTQHGSHKIKAIRISDSAEAEVTLDNLMSEGTHPTGDMQRMGGDLSFDNVPDGATYSSRYGGTHYIASRDLLDNDIVRATGAVLSDTFSKSDAVLWQCDSKNGKYRGSVYPALGPNTTWYAAPEFQDYLMESENSYPACGLIMSIKDDGIYVKDKISGTYQNANVGSEGKTGKPGNYKPDNTSEQNYFKQKSIIIAYCGDAHFDTMKVIDGGNIARYGNSFLEIVGDAQREIIVEVTRKQEDGPWGTGYPKFRLTGPNGNSQDITANAVSFGNNDIGRKVSFPTAANNSNDFKSTKIYTLSAKANPISDWVSLNAIVYPSQSFDIELEKQFNGMITEIKVGMGPLSAQYANSSTQNSGLFTGETDAKSGGLAFSMKWEERLANDSRKNEVLFAYSGKVNADLLKVEPPSIKIPVDGGALAGQVYVELSMDGKVSLAGEIKRDKDQPGGNGQIALNATIGGSAALSIGNEWIIKSSVGLNTSVTGCIELYGAPRNAPCGIALDGVITWDGLNVFWSLENNYGLEEEIQYNICPAKELYKSNAMTLINFK